MPKSKSKPKREAVPSTTERPLLARAADQVQRLVTGVSKGGAFGAPGAKARWTRSSKQSVGTAYHTSCQVWWTLARGVINEVYFPNVDRPNTRDLQFLITDGETFVHEEQSDLEHAIEYPAQDTLFARLTNSDPAGRYRIVKEVVCDPHHSVLLLRTHLEILDPKLRGKLRVFALLAPHLNRSGAHNSATLNNTGGHAFFHLWREDGANDPHSSDLHLAFGAKPDFLRRSCGYVGASDGWQDLQNFQMDWEFPSAIDGNIAVLGECDLSQGDFELALGFGLSPQSGATKVMQAFATTFDEHVKAFVKDWKGVCEGPAYEKFTGDDGDLFRISRCLLHTHEDKIFCGAIVASMSIPWGETKGDQDIGGYHLVWPRDLLQSCTALLSTGHLDAPGRALIWLASLQEMNGELPQNAWIDGQAFWRGLQLDEVAAPILLAWRVREAGALKAFDPWTVISRAAGYLIAHGPVTMQERWEEASGYSPATLAISIAALVIAAEFARERGDHHSADFALAYADWLEANVEKWTVTSAGEIVAGKARHFIRITPAACDDPHAVAEPDTAILAIVNGGGKHPAREIVGLDFLQLVRLGVRDAQDPLIVDSVEVADAALRYDLPQGPSWRRYKYDGYGQKEDGSAFDETGNGGCWPLLTGERGHYELAAGRDPLPYIRAMEGFANDGKMLPEQVWWNEDIAEFKKGDPTGSAMPLCWAHAEYMSLVRSAADGKVFGVVEPVYQRYVSQRAAPELSKHEMWSAVHQRTEIAAGKTLRVITTSSATIRWRASDGNSGEVITKNVDLGCCFADVPTTNLPAGSEFHFQILQEDSSSGDEYRIRMI